MIGTCGSGVRLFYSSCFRANMMCELAADSVCDLSDALTPFSLATHTCARMHAHTHTHIFSHSLSRSGWAFITALSGWNGSPFGPALGSKLKVITSSHTYTHWPPHFLHFIGVCMCVCVCVWVIQYKAQAKKYKSSLCMFVTPEGRPGSMLH